ncbi:hypothetical protein NWFMUON74_20950 [Nocardia wallacei]|uniref:Uncharacterized protein n=1 Tax=Nocardia wallacei TaxID=480035 RepID=A0A7G1KJI0_9NOCA|nr:hypothetical protein NWFMUON74_20950 [Nocardia wallacei]
MSLRHTVPVHQIPGASVCVSTSGPRSAAACGATIPKAAIPSAATPMAVLARRFTSSQLLSEPYLTVGNDNGPDLQST